jgi:hypothetical protein
MRLRARASHNTPVGTLGFGFWNDPFTLSLGQAGAARRIPVAPQALWFFYASTHSDLSMGAGGGGHGWTAMVVAFRRLPAFLLYPGLLSVYALARIPGLREPLFHLGRGAVRLSTKPLPESLEAWHSYALEWRPTGVRFLVDGDLRLETAHAPRPPLGFVAWIDNQFMCASPAAGLSFGTVPTEVEQWLEIESLGLAPS